MIKAFKQLQRPSARDFRELIFSCSRNADPPGCVYWLDQMSDFEFSPNACVYEAVAQSFAKRNKPGDLTNSEMWLETMMGERFSPSEQTVSVLLSAYSKDSSSSSSSGAPADKQRVVDFFDSLESCYHLPRKNVVMYSIMIEFLLLQHDDESAALELLTRMRAEGVQPNIRTYNSFVSYCSKHGNAIAADVWYAEIEKQKDGAHVQPDLATFTHLITAHHRQQGEGHCEGYCSKVDFYLREMRKHGHSEGLILAADGFYPWEIREIEFIL